MHDAFVSYAGADTAWATRLAKELRASSFDYFFAPETLRVGENWSEKLLESLEASRNLILLWSDEARQSDWVNEEVLRFRLRIEDAIKRQEPPGGTIIQIPLTTAYKPLEHVQDIRDIERTNGAYAVGPDAVDDATWTKIADSIERTIRDDDQSRRVPVLLLTSVATRMAAEIAHVPPGAPPIADLLDRFEIASDAELLACYGASREEWRPFASATPVRGVLETLRAELNAKLTAAGQRLLRWDYIDEEAFWGANDDAVIEAQAMRLDAEPTLIVVDPLSFYDELVRSRFSNFIQQRLMGREATFVLVLAPYSLPPSAKALRGAIQTLARQVFVHYYEPPVFDGRGYARCGANIGDAQDFKAWVMSTLMPAVVTAEQERAAVLSTGGTA